MTNQKKFLEACSAGNLAEAQRLYNLDKVDASDSNNYAIKWAARNGHLDVVKFLAGLDKVDASDSNNYAIRRAAENGHLYVVKFLAGLDGVNASARGNEAIIGAAFWGHLDVVKFLAGLGGVDASDSNNYAIRLAARNGHLDVVKFLLTLPGADASDPNNYAIRLAAENGHLDVVKFLLCIIEIATAISNGSLELNVSKLDVVGIANSVLKASEWAKKYPISDKSNFGKELLKLCQKLFTDFKSDANKSLVKFVVLREYLKGININWAFGEDLNLIAEFLTRYDKKALEYISECEDPKEMLIYSIIASEPFNTNGKNADGVEMPVTLSTDLIHTTIPKYLFKKCDLGNLMGVFDHAITAE